MLTHCMLRWPVHSINAITQKRGVISCRSQGLVPIYFSLAVEKEQACYSGANSSGGQQLIFHKNAFRQACKPYTTSLSF